MCILPYCSASKPGTDVAESSSEKNFSQKKRSSDDTSVMLTICNLPNRALSLSVEITKPYAQRSLLKSGMGLKTCEWKCEIAARRDRYRQNQPNQQSVRFSFQRHVGVITSLQGHSSSE